MKSILIVLISVMMISNSCKKTDDGKFVKGTVHYSDPALDGCGWSISFQEETLYPINLSAAFQKDGLKVLVDYQQAGERPCAWTSVKAIEIKSIKED